MQWLATAGNWVLKALWPIVVIVVGWHFVEADRGHKITTEAIDLLTDKDNAEKRKLSVWFVVYEMSTRNLFQQTYIPEKISSGMLDYIKSDRDLAAVFVTASSTSLVADRPKVEPSKDKEIRGTIYIQICGEPQRPFADQVKARLAMYQVPDFENVSKDGSARLCPDVNQVRYFRRDGEPAGIEIAAILNKDVDAASQFKLADLTSLGDQKNIPALQFEIWLAARSPAFN
jgi:hypothetical protein